MMTIGLLLQLWRWWLVLLLLLWRMLLLVDLPRWRLHYGWLGEAGLGWRLRLGVGKTLLCLAVPGPGPDGDHRRGAEGDARTVAVAHLLRLLGLAGGAGGRGEVVRVVGGVQRLRQEHERGGVVGGAELVLAHEVGGGGVVVAGVAARARGGGLLAGRQRHGGLVVEVGGEVVDMDGVRRLAAAHARDGDGDAVAGTRLQQVIVLMF